ncbi:MAG: malonic semialdehyde reductase [Betaproteobacteria bacterium]|nr:malonic semialdehyde reductase [Betaproteobacteria bacterium]
MLDEKGFDLLFRNARSQNGFTGEPVSDAQLRHLYEVVKWAPTTMNTQPMRLVFVKSAEAKQKLAPALSPGNLDKTLAAPVCAIIAWDSAYFENLPRMFAHRAQAIDLFKGPEKAAHAEKTAFRNGSMQGGYFILAARAIGLDCGPMSGFDNAKVDAAFFPDGGWKSNFLCTLGKGDPSKVMQRLPRLAFEEACRIV